MAFELQYLLYKLSIKKQNRVSKPSYMHYRITILKISELLLCLFIYTGILKYN